MTKEEAIETIRMAIAHIEWEYPMDYAVAFDMAIEALNQPEIIRCKDCKHWERRECGQYGTCENMDGFFTDDWYCADGERRSDE